MSRSKNPASLRGEDVEHISKELARAEGIPLHEARSRVRAELQKRAARAGAQHRPTIPARPAQQPGGQPRNDNGLTLAEWMARSNWSPARPVDEAERRWAANQPAGDRQLNPVPVEPPKAAKPKLAKLSEKQLRHQTTTAAKGLKAKSKAARDKASRQVCWLLWEGNRRGINLRPEADAHVAKANPVVAKRPQPPRRGNPLYHVPMIEDGMAEAIHVTAWANAEEEAGRSHSGKELSSIAPPVTPQARQRARELVRMIERENGHSIDDIFHAALAADGISQDAADEWAEKFGYYTAMQALGTGVSWADDHTTLDDLRVPQIEFHYLDANEYSEDPAIRKEEARRLPNPHGQWPTREQALAARLTPDAQPYGRVGTMSKQEYDDHMALLRAMAAREREMQTKGQVTTPLPDTYDDRGHQALMVLYRAGIIRQGSDLTTHVTPYGRIYYLQREDPANLPAPTKPRRGNPLYTKDFPVRATYWDPNATGGSGAESTYAKTYEDARAWLAKHAQPCWTQEILSGTTPRQVLWLSDREICEMARLLEGHGYDPDDASALYLQGTFDSAFKVRRALETDPASLGIAKKAPPAPAKPAKKGRARKGNPCGCAEPSAGMTIAPRATNPARSGKPDWNATELSADDRELVARIIAKAPIQTPEEQIDQRLRAALKKRAESPLGMAVRSYARQIVAQRTGAPSLPASDDVILLIDGESFSTLTDFLAQNEGLDPQDVAAVRQLQLGGVYYGGGGAGATWSVERVDPERYRSSAQGAHRSNPVGKDANLSAHQFMAVLRDQLQIGDRHVAMTNKSLGMIDSVFVTYVNLPSDVVEAAAGGGAEVFNNRMLWQVSGFDPKNPDAPAPKGKVSAKLSSANPDLRKAHPMRAKTGSPAAIAAYLAGIFQTVASSVPPKFTHTKRENPAGGGRRTGFRVAGYDGDYKAHSMMASATSHRIDQTFGNERAARDAAAAWAAANQPQGSSGDRAPYLFIEHVAARSAPRTIARWTAAGNAWRQER